MAAGALVHHFPVLANLHGALNREITATAQLAVFPHLYKFEAHKPSQPQIERFDLEGRRNV
jgi:hypothetical protein